MNLFKNDMQLSNPYNIRWSTHALIHSVALATIERLKLTSLRTSSANLKQIIQKSVQKCSIWKMTDISKF